MWSTELPSTVNIDAVQAFLTANFPGQWRMEQVGSTLTFYFNNPFITDRFAWSLQQGLFD